MHFSLPCLLFITWGGFRLINCETLSSKSVCTSAPPASINNFKVPCFTLGVGVMKLIRVPTCWCWVKSPVKTDTWVASGAVAPHNFWGSIPAGLAGPEAPFSPLSMSTSITALWFDSRTFSLSSMPLRTCISAGTPATLVIFWWTLGFSISTCTLISDTAAGSPRKVTETVLAVIFCLGKTTTTFLVFAWSLTPSISLEQLSFNTFHSLIWKSTRTCMLVWSAKKFRILVAMPSRAISSPVTAISWDLTEIKTKNSLVNCCTNFCHSWELQTSSIVCETKTVLSFTRDLRSFTTSLQTSFSVERKHSWWRATSPPSCSCEVVTSKSYTRREMRGPTTLSIFSMPFLEFSNL